MFAASSFVLALVFVDYFGFLEQIVEQVYDH